jgi:parallel beta-helix repeat protein
MLKKYNNSIYNNTIYDCLTGIELDSSDSNNISNNNIYNVTQAIFIQEAPSAGQYSYNNYFYNNLFNATTLDIFSNITNNNILRRNYFVNNTYNTSKVSVIGNYTLWFGWYVDAFVNDSYGAVNGANVTWINYLNPSFNGYGENLTNSSGLIPRRNVYQYTQNATSNYTLQPYNFTASKDTRYTLQSETITSNRIDLARVNLFLTNSINLTDCRILNVSNSTYTLTDDVSSDGTCYTIRADNITLDCKNHVILYANLTTGYGVLDDLGADNTLIENCQFHQYNESVQDSHGIYTNGHSYYNHYVLNTFDMRGLGSDGINLFYVFNSTIEKNNFKMPNSQSASINLDQYCVNNLITGNVVACTSGLEDCNGIEIGLNSNQNNFSTGSFNTPSGYDFYPTGSSGNYNFLNGVVLVDPNGVLEDNTLDINYTGAMKLDYSDSPADDPTGFQNLSRYVYLYGQMNLDKFNFHYTDADVVGRNESNLTLLAWNGAWTRFSTKVNLTDNFVSLSNGFRPSNPNRAVVWAIMEMIVEPTGTINAPENLSIFLREDNVTTKLNWSVCTGAEGYEIYYNDNLTEILQLNNTSERIADVVLVGESNNTWNDTTANESTRRFYRVSAYVDGGLTKNISAVNETVGYQTLSTCTFTMILSAPIEQNISVNNEIHEAITGDLIVTKDYIGGNDYTYFDGTNWLNEAGLPEDYSLNSTLGYYFDLSHNSSLIYQRNPF